MSFLVYQMITILITFLLIIFIANSLNYENVLPVTMLLLKYKIFIIKYVTDLGVYSVDTHQKKYFCHF